MKEIDIRSYGLFRDLKVNVEKGDLLWGNQLTQLLPYIRFAIAQQHLNQAVTINKDKNGITFANLSESDKNKINELLEIVIDGCNKVIKDVIVVPQYMGENKPKISHKIFNFAVEKYYGNDTICVRFTWLSDSHNFEVNSFDVALKMLAGRYPGVVKVPKFKVGNDDGDSDVLNVVIPGI